MGEDRLHRARHRQVRQAGLDEGQAAADQPQQPLPLPARGPGGGRDPLKVRPLLHLAVPEWSVLQVRIFDEIFLLSY